MTNLGFIPVLLSYNLPFLHSVETSQMDAVAFTSTNTCALFLIRTSTSTCEGSREPRLLYHSKKFLYSKNHYYT